jgi:hypothetical protein
MSACPNPPLLFPEAPPEELLPADDLLAVMSKIFQNRRVSSPAADTTVVPSGDRAICKTLEVCPDSSATRVKEGYFHTTN